MRKRIVSLLMTILIIATMLPVQALAAELANSRAAEDEIVLEEEAVIPPEEKAPEEAPQAELPMEQPEDSEPAEQPTNELAESSTAMTSATIVVSGYCGGEGDGTNLTWTLDSNGLLTISGKGEMDSWYRDNSMPWSDNALRIKQIAISDGVTGIGRNAFKNCSNLVSIDIPRSVTNIGFWAFQGCSSLIDITIPKGVTDITGVFRECSSLNSVVISEGVISIDGAFFGCSSLVSITIPDSVTTFGSNTFYGCSSLTNVSIPGKVTGIGSQAFWGCSRLTNITIPNSVTYIGDSAFFDCRGLTSITIPDSVTSIGLNAFRNCVNLTSIILSSSITTIMRETFSGCSSLTGIDIPSGVSEIGSRAFEGCSNLASVEIPENVSTISGYTFKGCSSLTRIVLPDSITTIGGEAFYGCSSLTSINLPKRLTDIGGTAFAGCSSLAGITIPNGVTSIGCSAFSSCSSLKTITIPDGITEIPEYTFSDCITLRNITIPNSVTTIGCAAFRGCKSLTDVSIPSNIVSIGKDYAESRGGAFEGCSGLVSIEIPNHVTHISESTFRNCSGLTTIVLPESITSIGAAAFYGCSSLTNIDLPKGITDIGSSAFERCSSLTDIEIPDGITAINNDTFENCKSLTSIEIPDSVTFIGQDVFGGCSSLTSITIPDGVTSIGYNSWEVQRNIGVFANCTSLTNIVIPQSVKTIGMGAFSGCSNLVSVVIPDSVTFIGNCAFAKCSRLTDVAIPEGITSISDKMFFECTNLTRITIPKNVTAIGSYAFFDCANLTNITIPENVMAIGNSAFSGCSSLTNISIPEKVTDIGIQAFRGCTGLTNIIIPENVTTLSSGVFSGCSSLTSIVISENVTTVDSGAFAVCTSLSSIVIPENVTTIGSSAFSGCTSLSSIDLPKEVISLGHSTFEGCCSLVDIVIPDNVTEIAADLFSGCSNLTYIAIPEGVTRINCRAFYGCSKLADVYYTGTELQWNSIDVQFSNDFLTSATVHYNSTPPKLTTLTFSSVQYPATVGNRLQLFLHLVAPNGNCEGLVSSLVLTSTNSEVFSIESQNIHYEVYGDTTADIVITATPTVSSGSATITAMLSDGTSAFCEVIVVGQDTMVTLRKDLYAIKVDDTGTLYMTAINGELLPELQWKWTSSDESIVSIKAGDGSYQASGDEIPAALISAQCTFIAKKRGNATITCTLSNGATAVCRITVYNAEDDAETIKSNEYNAAQYNESDFTYAVKQIGKLRDDWEKKYKKYISAVDGVLKPLDNEADILTALQSKENAARQIRQADEAASKKSNMMLTFAAGFPEEWKDGAYEILCDIFESRVDNKVSFSSIDLSKEISASAAIVNEVCSGMWNESGTKTYMYAKNKAVFVRYSCMGLLTEGFGYMTFSRGHQSYTVSICSNMESAKNCMAIYLNACKALGQKSVQNARKATIKDMLALIGANELTEPVFKAQITKGLKAYNAYLEEVGLAELSDSLTEIYSYYDSIKRIVGAIKGMNPESLAANKKTLQKELDNLMNPDFGTSEATKVSKALAELKIASQKLYNALDEFVAKGCLSKESGLEWPFSKKTQVKCPVDVEIYRGDTLIGYVGETESWYDDSIYVEENDDAKIIYSSAGDELSIKLTGTDYGSLSITVEEFSNGSPVERLNYYDIDLQEGKNISFVVPAQMIGEVKDTLTVLDGEVQIPASEYISADTDAAVYIDVDISDDEAGTVSGDGVYVRGDAVVLKASAVSGYLFAGWYDEDGHLVSASSSYEFSASVDCSFLAKYVRVTLLGDVNGDGIVDVYDLQSLYECCCDIGSLTGNPFPCADVNQDTKISILDVQMLYAYLTTGNWTYPQT